MKNKTTRTHTPSYTHTNENTHTRTHTRTFTLIFSLILPFITSTSSTPSWVCVLEREKDNVCVRLFVCIRYVYVQVCLFVLLYSSCNANIILLIRLPSIVAISRGCVLNTQTTRSMGTMRGRSLMATCGPILDPEVTTTKPILPFTPPRLSLGTKIGLVKRKTFTTSLFAASLRKC